MFIENAFEVQWPRLGKQNTKREEKKGKYIMKGFVIKRTIVATVISD